METNISGPSEYNSFRPLSPERSPKEVLVRGTRTAKDVFSFCGRPSRRRGTSTQSWCLVRRAGGLRTRADPLPQDPGSHGPLPTGPQAARRGDAADAGLSAWHHAPHRLPDLPDADAPLHLPAVWGSRLPREPRVRRLRGTGRGSRLRCRAPAQPAGCGCGVRRPDLRVRDGPLVPGCYRGGIHPQRHVRIRYDRCPATLARVPQRPLPAALGLPSGALPDQPPYQRFALASRPSLRRPRRLAQVGGCQARYRGSLALPTRAHSLPVFAYQGRDGPANGSEQPYRLRAFLVRSQRGEPDRLVLLFRAFGVAGKDGLLLGAPAR